MGFFSVFSQEQKFEDIIKSAKKRESSWLSKIFDLYHEKIYNFVIRRTWNVEDTENICSIIWERICKHIEKFDSDNKNVFEWWIMTISRNQIITYKTKKRIQTEDIDEHISIKDESPDPLEMTKINSWNEYMFTLLHKLPDKQAECIRLKYFDWYKNKEIAKILEIKEASVASNLKRWLEKLKEIIW